MAYTSLYRRYRPDTFSSVVGQEHIVRTLRNQIKLGAIGHAYLFTGTRGTGKTSVAKIFAKAVNCTNNVNGSPCLECETCRALSSPTSLDILEIDAASNNSVDQIRELTDKINFPPTIGRYKVYIIDEVHMLSKSAYNALLKTLEEPPAHAIFILATTEVHQIPATILSRCLRFDFHLLPINQIVDRLKYIFTDIKVQCDPNAMRLIASAGKGSMRDALSIADMCVSYCAGNVTYDGVLEVLGTADPFKILALADSILSGDADGALKQLSTLCDLGKSVPVLASDLATTFRNLAYVVACSNAKEILVLPNDLYVELQSRGSAYSLPKILAAMKAMTALEGQFRYGTQHRTLFEAAVVDATTASPHVETVEELTQKVETLEKTIKQLQRSGFNPAPAKADARKVWGRVVSALTANGRQYAAIAATDATVEETTDAFRVKIATASSLSLLEEASTRKLINDIFSQISKKKLFIELSEGTTKDQNINYLKEMFGSKLVVK